MALSKIEKAGMDASKLKDLMSGSGSVPSSPGKEDQCGSEDFDDTDADSLLASSDTEKEEYEANITDENALSELEAEIQGLAARESFCNQSPGDFEEIEPEVDSEVPSDDDEDYEDDEDDLFYEEEIVELLNELVDAVEEAHGVELDGDHERSSSTSEELEADEYDDEEEMKYSVEAQLEADLEEAKLSPIPDSPASSEIEILLESEVLVNFSTEHRIESEAKTELMDIGKSDTTVLGDGGRSNQHSQGRHDETTASGHEVKPSKNKSKAASKRKVR